MNSLQFHIVDVFAEKPLAGNQLAVFISRGAIGADEMQRLAREMNYSETTFIESVDPREGGFDVRIFTPQKEVPFAGHPTLGTAYLIQQEIIRQPVESLKLNLKIGQIPVEFSYRGTNPDVIWMVQPKPAFGRTLEPASLHEVLGVELSDIDDRFPIQESSTGFPFIIIPLKTLDAVKRISIQRDRCFELIEQTEAKALLAFAPETYSPENDLNVRVFADYYGTPEDPATGSANGSLAAYLVENRYFGGDSIDIRVEQGYEIGRPSLLFLRSAKEDGSITVRVGGRVQPFASATYKRPNGVPDNESKPVGSVALKPFGTSIFSEITALANRLEAVNLGQGFPDFPAPSEIVEAAMAALKANQNQYARSMGHPVLVNAIAEHQRHFYNLEYDPMSEVTVFCGAAEGIASSLLGLLNPGDEVILFEPFYDSYPACVAMARSVPRFVSLRPPDFSFDPEELAAAFTSKTRVLIINNPHNPTGKVFSRSELETIAQLCQKHNVVVLADEVYEHFTYDDAQHIPMATLPGMRERTLTLSSSGKVFSLTGWRIGWVTGPAELAWAAQAAHQYITFAVPTPLQVAIGHALSTHTEDYLAMLKKEYTERRNFLMQVLSDCGFKVTKPRGAYYIVADFSALHDTDDRTFVRDMMERCKVAAVPLSGFCNTDSPIKSRHLRFAFCKQMETLRAASSRLTEARLLGALASSAV
jgi:N-succinyldiaminopimelate aminotransferase